MHDAAMLLRRAQVARIFEGHPWMTGLKDHAQHLAPQVLCFQGFVELELAASRHLFVVLVALLECGAVKIMEIGDIIR